MSGSEKLFENALHHICFPLNLAVFFKKPIFIEYLSETDSVINYLEYNYFSLLIVLVTVFSCIRGI